MTLQPTTLQKWHGHDFPKVLEAGTSRSLPDFIKANREAIDTAMQNTGAVLFRGFDVPDIADFDAAVVAYGAENFPYKESLSNAVRVNMTPRVFTANEAPPETSIFLHHEMAQTPIYPSALFFYCHIPANQGGATPLCRSDIVLEKLGEIAPDIVTAFEQKGVRYTNTMPGQDDHGSGQGRSWRSTLGADTRDAAEARLSDLGYSWDWQDGDTLRVTSPKLEAVRALPGGRKVFFNQLIAAYRGWSDTRNDASKSVSFGDGSVIPPETMDTAIQIADEISYDLQWQAGDVALVNNFLVMHGRRPYQGTRKVLASLIK